MWQPLRIIAANLGFLLIKPEKASVFDGRKGKSLLKIVEVVDWLVSQVKEGEIIVIISSRLKSELTGVRGFSESNIKNMRLFYDEWSPYVNRQPMAGDINYRAIC